MIIRRLTLLAALPLLCGLLSGCATLFISEEPWKEASEGITRNRSYYKWSIDDLYGHIDSASIARLGDKCHYGYHGENSCIKLGSRTVDTYDQSWMSCDGLRDLECDMNYEFTNFNVVVKNSAVTTACLPKTDTPGASPKIWVNGQQWEAKTPRGVVRLCLNEKDGKEFAAATEKGGIIIVDAPYLKEGKIIYQRSRIEVNGMYRDAMKLLVYMSTRPKMNERLARYLEDCKQPERKCV